MQYASSAHAASAGSYEFGMNSLSRLRERAGVRERLPLLAGSTLTPPAGEGIEAGEVTPFPSGFLSFPLWLSLLPPLGEGRDGGQPALIHAAVALHDSRQFP